MNCPITYIYALIDPRNGRVRYVGKSNNPHRRLLAHMLDKTKSHRTSWLKEIGRRPKVMILQVVSVSKWVEAETGGIKKIGRESLLN